MSRFRKNIPGIKRSFGQTKRRTLSLSYRRFSEPSNYGIAVLSGGHRKCEKEVIRQCRELLKKRLEYTAEDDYGFFDATMNAHLVESAEKYYRSVKNF